MANPLVFHVPYPARIAVGGLVYMRLDKGVTPLGREGKHDRQAQPDGLVGRRTDRASCFIDTGEFMLNVFRLAAMLASTLMLLASPVWAQPAPDGNSVLIYSNSGTTAYSTAATGKGFTVVTATDAQWSARSTADFATFRALIIGDDDCGGTVPAGPLASAATWAAAINGPKLFIGTDEFFHFGSGGGTFLSSGISYVTSGGAGQTGAYVSLSCYYDSSTPTAVALLAPFGAFTAEGNLGCYNNAHIVAIHPALSGSTDATLSNWSCSVHEVFRSFPSGFIPLVIARNITGTGSLTFSDGSFGVPYILASGGGIVPIGTATNPIPTLSEWSLIAMGVLVLLVGAVVLRKRTARRPLA